MKVNDLVELEGRPYRVLAVGKDRVLCIELSGTHMPVWLNLDDVQQNIKMNLESPQNSVCAAYKILEAVATEKEEYTPRPKCKTATNRPQAVYINCAYTGGSY